MTHGSLAGAGSYPTSIQPSYTPPPPGFCLPANVTTIPLYLSFSWDNASLGLEGWGPGHIAAGGPSDRWPVDDNPAFSGGVLWCSFIAYWWYAIKVPNDLSGTQCPTSRIASRENMAKIWSGRLSTDYWSLDTRFIYSLNFPIMSFCLSHQLW